MSDTYFSEYENLEVHELMLKDRPRQESYYNAILKNQSLFRDKIVLDIGAGTGILSIFCAKAGAKLVYAIEASKLAIIAVETVEENELTSVIKVIHSMVEDFNLPSGIDKVDIIVSEWMGFYLLHEGMLDSVLYARDKFLKEDGLMFPQYATIYVAPCSIPSLFDYFEDVDGVKMTRFAAKMRAKKSEKPEIMEIHPDDLLHEGIVMAWFDLMQVTTEELNTINFSQVVTIGKTGNHQGFCIWFDCKFPSAENQEAEILSTSPYAPLTHWKQCAIVLPKRTSEYVETGEPLAFQITMTRVSADSRKYNIEVELQNPEDVEHPLPCKCHLTKCILTKAHLESLEKNLKESEMENPS